SRTSGLFRTSLPGPVPDLQWPETPGFRFAVNPVSPALLPGGTRNGQAVVSSAQGRVYRTRNSGLRWDLIAAVPPGVSAPDLDRPNGQALTYGAPEAGATASMGNLDLYIRAGTVGGRIFVTFLGGGDDPGGVRTTRWRDLSLGLDGSPVVSIVTNPNRGS